MTTTVYRERANRYRSEIDVILAACAIGIVVLAGLDYSGSGTVNWVWLFFILLLFWLWFISGDGEKGPSTLKLDDQGLTYAHRWAIRCWTWTELSAVEFPSGVGEFDYYIRLRFGRRIDWKTRMTMPGIPLNGSELRIRPIFDTPLTDICAKLNDYRERARSGGDAAGSPNATSRT